MAARLAPPSSIPGFSTEYRPYQHQRPAAAARKPARWWQLDIEMLADLYRPSRGPRLALACGERDYANGRIDRSALVELKNEVARLRPFLHE